MRWLQQVVDHRDSTLKLKQRLSDIIGDQHLIATIGSFIGDHHEQIGYYDFRHA